MKKVIGLFLMILIAGCGVSGSGPTDGPLVNVTSNNMGETGKVIVNIADSAAKTVALGTLPTATRLRMAINNSSVYIDGKSFKYIVDTTIANSLTSIPFPVGRNYTLELVTYIPQVDAASGLTVNRLIKYAKQSFDVVAGTVTVNLSPQLIEATVTINEASYLSGTEVTSTAHFLAEPTPLQARYNLFLKLAKPTTALHLGADRLPDTSPFAPIVSGDTTYHAQAEFYISNSLLDSAGDRTIYNGAGGEDTGTAPESHRDWTFNYPNHGFAEAADPTVSIVVAQGAVSTGAAGDLANNAVVGAPPAAPTITAFTTPAIVNTLTVPTSITIPVVAGAVRYYMIKEGAAPVAPSATDSGWLSSFPISKTLTGTYASGATVTLTAYVRGGVVGQAIATDTNTLVYDPTVPAVVTVTPPAAAAPSLTVTGITIDATDNIGVVGYYISATNVLPAAPVWVTVATTASFNTATAEYTFGVLPVGDTPIYVWVKDAAGNVSASGTATLDFTP